MPIELKCENCGSSLQIEDQHAGKKIRCPKCQTVSAVPAPSSAAAPSAKPFPAAQQPRRQLNQSAAAGPTAGNPSAATPMSNPYSSPVPSTAPQAASGGFQELWPLLDAVFFIKATAWTMFIVGGIYCITIVGIIFAWLPIWMGVCLNRAAAGIEHGCRAGDPQSIVTASTNLSTFFKIIGVLALINLSLIVLYFGFVMLALIVGVVGGAAGA